MAKEWKVMSVRLDADVVEAFKLIKERSGANNMSEAARQFIKLHEPDLYRDAHKIAVIRMSRRKRRQSQ